jgi:CARDB
MKKVVLTLFVFICQYGKSIAQNPPLNSKDVIRSGQTNGDPDRLRPLSPADLQAIECSFVAVTRDEVNKKLKIQVSIKVKNTGEAPAGNSTVKAYYKSPSGTGTLTSCTSSLPVGRLVQGQEFIKVYTFLEPLARFRERQVFDFWIKADANSRVAEGNESNNQSAVIKITTPSR